MRLHTRIALGMAVLITGLVVILAGLLFVQFERTIEETRKTNTRALTEAVVDRVQKRADGMARFLAESVANSLYHHRLDAMRELNLTAARQHGVVYVWVYDTDARIILDGTEYLKSYGKVLSDPMVTETLDTGADVIRIEDGMVYVSMAAKVGSQVLGGVKVAISLLDMENDLARLTEEMGRADREGCRCFLKVVGYATLFFILVGVGFSLMIARGISTPIERLVDRTRRIAKGDFDADVPVRGASEIMELDRALWTMAQARKRAEAEARQLQAQAAHAARVAAVGEMATGLAHELNQPLTSTSAFVKGSLVRLRALKEVPGDVLTAMEKAVSETQRAGKIIHRIREFVQKKSVDREPRDVNLLVRETVDLIRSEASWQGVSITFDLAADLPLAVIDPIQIQQVILNFLRNSLDALVDMPPARRRIRVSTSRIADDRVKVAVTDTGHGIGSEIRASLFQPFVTTKKQGLGMGFVHMSFDYRGAYGPVGGLGGRRAADHLFLLAPRFGRIGRSCAAARYAGRLLIPAADDIRGRTHHTRRFRAPIFHDRIFPRPGAHRSVFLGLGSKKRQWPRPGRKVPSARRLRSSGPAGPRKSGGAVPPRQRQRRPFGQLDSARGRIPHQRSRS